MDKNFSYVNKIEKVLEENSLIILLESKVIIKKDTERIEFYLRQISNVRIFKKRNLAYNYIMFITTAIFYSSASIAKNEDDMFRVISILLILILFTISCLLKTYKHKLLINKGILGFSEIALSKKNIPYAENFVEKFKKNSFLKIGKEDFDNLKMKECL